MTNPLRARVSIPRAVFCAAFCACLVSCGIESTIYLYPPNVLSPSSTSLIYNFDHNTSNVDASYYVLYYRLYTSQTDAAADLSAIESNAATLPDSAMNWAIVNKGYLPICRAGSEDPLIEITSPAFTQSYYLNFGSLNNLGQVFLVTKDVGSIEVFRGVASDSSSSGWASFESVYIGDADFNKGSSTAAAGSLYTGDLWIQVYAAAMTLSTTTYNRIYSKPVCLGLGSAFQLR